MTYHLFGCGLERRNTRSARVAPVRDGARVVERPRAHLGKTHERIPTQPEVRHSAMDPNALHPTLREPAPSASRDDQTQAIYSAAVSVPAKLRTPLFERRA